MPRIYYLPDGVEVETDHGNTILDASLAANVPHTHACGGKARCSTCRVIVIDGLECCADRTPNERVLAERLRFDVTIRLACQTAVTGNVKVRRLVLDEEDVAFTSQLEQEVAAGAAGEEKQLAVLFSDIRGFTAFSEALLAYDVIHVLNRYFRLMGQVIHQTGGYIDNYMGDGLMALFGIDDPQGAPLQAVKAGLGMLAAVEGLKQYVERLYGRNFQIGVGVHFGEAVVGTIGALGRKRMTAIGDAVNFAARVEAANKDAGTKFLISDDTYARVKDAVVVGKSLCLTVPGKTGLHTLFEVTGLAG